MSMRVKNLRNNQIVLRTVFRNFVKIALLNKRNSMISYKGRINKLARS